MRRLQTGNVLVIKSLVYTIPDGPTSYLGTLDIRESTIMEYRGSEHIMKKMVVKYGLPSLYISAHNSNLQGVLV